MTIGKRILALLGLLVLFMVYSVYSFDYDKTLEKDETEQIQEEEGLFNNLKNKLASFVDSSDDNLNGKPLVFELIKQNGTITINGTFKDESQVKDVNDILNINNKGDLKYDESMIMDVELLNKISSLVTPFKDFFFDGAKLLVSNGQVSLEGKLKDTNYKDLLESIITRVDIEVKTNIQEPDLLESQDVVEGKENTSSIVSEDSKVTDVVSPEKELDEKNTAEVKDLTKDVVLPVVEQTKPVVDEKKEETKVVAENEKPLVEEPKKEEKTEEFVPKPLPKKAINLSAKSNDVQTKINNLLASKKIVFKRKSSQMTDESNLVVQEIAKILKENPNISIEISGHTDSRGRSSLNRKISQERASSIMEYLISQGIDKTKLTAIGYGEEYPIAKDDEQGLSEANRRVEFNIIGE